MVNQCSICGIEKSQFTSHIIFHNLPKNLEMRKLWLETLQKKDTLTNILVCSDHFTTEDYKQLCDRPLLKKDAVPSLNLSKLESTENNEMNLEDSIETDRHQEIQSTSQYKSQELLDSIVTNVPIDESTVSIEINKSFERNMESTILEIDKNSQELIDIPKETAVSTKAQNHLKRKSDSSNDSSKPTKKCCILKNLGVFRKEDFKDEAIWNHFTTTMKKLRKKTELLYRKNERLYKKVETYKGIIHELKKRNLLTDSAVDMLNKTCTPTVQKLIGRIINKKQGQYAPQLKEFACTLHFYYPAAYQYVRKTFMNMLPHQSTIRCWLKSANHKPGISEDALKHLSRLCKEATTDNKKLYFSLTCDEMAIRKLVEFDGKQWHGFVDFGNNTDESFNTTEAKNAWVFMLVGINKYVKIVISYYLIDGLTGIDRSNVLKEILHAAHNEQIPICNITFDGASTNIAMVEALGANLSTYNKIKTYFEHPVTGERVTVMLDACHMMKLIRNILKVQQCLSDMDGNTVKWKYIELLVEKQEQEGLHLGTKVRHKHIHFENEKMKVRLATQTLSASVANALKVCEHDLKLPEFKGASATAKFCEIMNDSFDILNSKNLLAKNPSKHAISIENLKDVKVRTEINIKYIESLKINGTSILTTRSKTGFLGLIVCLKSVILLAESIFSEKYMTFLLTYKFSQDHLETFFSCIRRCGGWNNNPTVRQFVAALKKLQAHVNIDLIFNSNCIPQDDTIFLNRNDQTEKEPDKDSNNNNIISSVCQEKSEDNFIWDLEHDYAGNSSFSLSEYQEDVITYIAGFIAKQTEKKICCSRCKETLKQNTVLSHLQKRKQYGNLFNASDDVIKICKAGEKVFRINENILTDKNIKEKLIVLTIQQLTINELFANNNVHVFDQAPLMDHKNQLIRILLENFFILRLRHYANSKYNSIRRIRTKLTKLITFQHQ